MGQHTMMNSITRRWRPLVAGALFGLLLGGVGIVVGEDSAPIPVPVTRYDACHALLIDTAIPPGVEQVDVRNLAQLAERVTQGEIPGAVAAGTDGLDSGDVAERVRVTVRSDVERLTICAVGETPAATAGLADRFATQLLTFLQEEADDFHVARLANAEERSQSAQDCRADVAAELEALLAFNPEADTIALDEQAARCRLELTRANADLVEYRSAGVPIVPLETLEPAVANEIPESTFEARLRSGAAGTNIISQIGSDEGLGSSQAKKARSPLPTGPAAQLGGGLVLGLLAGGCYVAFTERLDSRLRRKEEVESILDLPVLAEIPPLTKSEQASEKVLAAEQPRSRLAESYRALRSAIDYAGIVEADRGIKRPGGVAVLVTSAGPGEGKTTTVANLAAVMGEAGLKVLIVNCDFRRPRVHRFVGGDVKPQKVTPTDLKNVYFVAQLTPSDADSSPSDVVAAQRRLVEQGRAVYDVVLLDTAPILTTNDAAEVLAVIDHVVLVVAAGQTKADSAARAAELLERRGRAALGVALVGARDVPNSADYYYSNDDPYLERRERTSIRSS